MEKSVSININDTDYQQLIDSITTLWGEAKAKAITAVNTELLDANWQTGKYIVEYEQGGKHRAEYGKRLLVNLAKDLTARNGKGFNRTNLTYMRKLYLAFPKCGTLSHILTWSHYYELLKCDNALEMQFYYKECIKEGWKVRWLYTFFGLRGCVKSEVYRKRTFKLKHPTRPERGISTFPRASPWEIIQEIATRPVRAKALVYSAFALTGRVASDA